MLDRSHRDGAEEAPDDRCEGVRRENSILGEGVKVAIGNILKPATAYIEGTGAALAGHLVCIS